MSKGIRHIDHIVVAKTHSPMYLMHKYWARKPANVVAEYIKAYSKPKQIVLDPFVGSGVTVIEAIKYDRKGIGVDLDPVAIHITYNTAIPIDLEKLKKAFNNIQSSIKNKIDGLFVTSCPYCNKKVITEATIWQKDKPREIRFRCDCLKAKGRTNWKKVDGNDSKRITSANKISIPYWFPNNELIWNTRINVHRGMKVAELFTHRNLFSLSAILDAIEKIRDQKIRDVMKFCFTSAIPQASKMVFVIRKRGRLKGKIRKTKEVGSWATRGYWMPEEYFEVNPWNCFYKRFEKLLRGKQEVNEEIGENFKIAKAFRELKNDKNLLLLNQSATKLANIPSNSIDYIFTDPPYGDAIPYLELDLMWASWLKNIPNFEEEIIISDSPIRKKKFDEYFRLLRLAFQEAYRALKPGRWMTVTFHSTDIKIYNSIIRAVVFAGFELEKILYQHPARASAKALLAPHGSAIGDYYIRFYKPVTKRSLKTEKEIDEVRFEKIVVESIKKIIAVKGEPVSYNDILKNIYIELDKYGYLLAAEPEKIDSIMEKYKNREFVFIKNKGWWFAKPSKYLLHIVPVKDRVEIAITQLLKRKHKVSFDEVLQEMFIKFKNALTPEPPSVKAILSEYAMMTSDGMWQIKPSVEEREKQHHTLIYFLCELGTKAGFNVFTGHQSAQFSGKRVIDLKGYKGIDKLKNLRERMKKRVKKIDVVWHKKGLITHIYEIENTTGITEAVVRGSNIPYEVKRYIVIPEERDKLLQMKIQEPLLTDEFKQGRWKTIYYSELEMFYLEKKRKRFSAEEIDGIVGKKGRALVDLPPKKAGGKKMTPQIELFEKTGS